MPTHKHYFCIICGKDIVEGSFCEKCSMLEEDIYNKAGKSEAGISMVVCPICKITDKGSTLTDADKCVKLKWKICNSCAKLKRKSFDIKIQVRFPEKKRKKTVEDSIQAIIHHLEKNFRWRYSLAHVRNGIDIEFIDVDNGEKFVRFLRSKYGALSKTTRKLITISSESGRKIYRLTIAVYMPNFSPYEPVIYRGQLYIIKSINSKYIKIEQSDTGKQKIINRKNEKELRKIDKTDIEEGIISSITYNSIYLTLNKDYRTVEFDINAIGLKNSDIKEGDTILLIDRKHILKSHILKNI